MFSIVFCYLTLLKGSKCLEDGGRGADFENKYIGSQSEEIKIHAISTEENYCSIR